MLEIAREVESYAEKSLLEAGKVVEVAFFTDYVGLSNSSCKTQG